MSDLPKLKWYAKPFGPGDTDGTGAQRLLGQPDLSLSELLVRETAQNSWDASIGVPGTPEFQMRYRHLDQATLEILRTHVFTECVAESALARSLGSNTLEAVEIVDRGTRGLGGPTRNDRTPNHNEVTDYADFVLTIGAPPDHAHGGGTYGYGKTASYMASSCSTILIWSRARNPRTGLIDERFIVSAMDQSFANKDGKKFTGRQWWGASARDGNATTAFAVEPLVGHYARLMGESIFERPFADGETGTSLLILAPRMDADDAERSTPVEQWASAIRQNLWPKMMADQPEQWSMDISLLDGHSPIDLVYGRTAGGKAKERCLAAIRVKQDDKPLNDPFTQVFEITHGTYRQTLGHLALTRVMDPDHETSDTELNTVTYMRHKAELVVRIDSLGLPAPEMPWVGVFKPVLEVDKYFAMAEPPAHDSWNPANMLDRRAKSCVNVALNKIRDRVKMYLEPQTPEVEASEQASTGALSATLGGLVAGDVGNRATSRGKATKARKRSRSTQSSTAKLTFGPVRPMDPRPDDLIRGRARTRVQLHNPHSVPLVVRPQGLAISIDGATGVDASEVTLAAWEISDSEFEAEECELEAGGTIHAHITYPEGVAIKFDFVGRPQP